jgi:septal ring factor EnvC (AmiA/AmiB activator)
MKKRITCLFIFVASCLFCFAGTVLHAADDAAARKKELQRIKREMLEEKKELKRAGRKEHSILTDLDRIDWQVQAGKAELAEQQKLLREAEASLRRIEASNSEIGRELSGLKQAYGQRLRALYKMSRSGYAVELLVSDGQADPLKRIKYLGMIAERDRSIIRDYGFALNALAFQQAEVAEKKKGLLERKYAIETKKKELQARKRTKAVLLASVREKKGLHEEALRELEESSVSLWAMIRKAEQSRSAQAPRASRQTPRITGTGRTNRLPWPLGGEVLTRFGMQRHPELGNMVYRRGIEIAAREGEPVRAVNDGEVAYADWYKGYGNLVIIEHGPGFYTLYGYLSQLDLRKGERVAQGQVIGLAGDTGSLKGSKLYFEMRRNGEAQDPLVWLAKR